MHMNQDQLHKRLAQSRKMARVDFLTENTDQPASLAMPPGNRDRYRRVARGLLDAGAVEAWVLDKTGGRLDTIVISEVVERAAEQSPRDASLALLAAEMRKSCVDAYNSGAEAASRGSENLVQVVNILTTQWSSMMTAVQTLSLQLARALRANGGGDGDDGMSAQMQQLLGLATLKMMGLNGVPPTDPTKKNGSGNGDGSH